MLSARHRRRGGSALAFARDITQPAAAVSADESGVVDADVGRHVGRFDRDPVPRFELDELRDVSGGSRAWFVHGYAAGEQRIQRRGACPQHEVFPPYFRMDGLVGPVFVSMLRLVAEGDNAAEAGGSPRIRSEE